ncbi:hypothetical protein [Rhizobium arsenicireducens]
MKVEDIDRQIAELQELRALAAKEAEEKKIQQNFEEALEIYPRLIADIRRLDVIGYMPPRLAEALRDGSGKFNPGMYIKRPRPPVKPHD